MSIFIYFLCTCLIIYYNYTSLFLLLKYSKLLNFSMNVRKIISLFCLFLKIILGASTFIGRLDFQISRNNKKFAFKISHYFPTSFVIRFYRCCSGCINLSYWSLLTSLRWTIKASKLRNDHTPSKSLYLFNGYLLFYFHLQAGWKQKVSR